MNTITHNYKLLSLLSQKGVTVDEALIKNLNATYDLNIDFDLFLKLTKDD